MKKIRVAFFAEALIEDFDGASRTTFQILKRIPASRFEFLFICGTGPDELFGFECFKIPTVPLPFTAIYRMGVPQFSRAKLTEKLIAFKPDVIHIASPSLAGQFALQFAKQHHVPVISIYHTHFISYIAYYLRHIPFLINFIKARFIINQRNFYNRCTKIYIPSETIREELAAIGIDILKMKIWKRGIDRNLFSPGKKDETLMRQLTGNNDPVILFASRLVWEKNLETLFRIHDMIQSQGLKYNLIVAGDGAARSACESRMTRAIFTGKVDHETLAGLYASSDVFLFTSISETIGNVVLEAMASGLPCVIADGGGSKDFIQQGITGFKCQPNNEADYVEKIKLVLENSSLHQALAAEGIAQSRLFNWENLTDIYFSDITDLAGQMEVA